MDEPRDEPPSPASASRVLDLVPGMRAVTHCKGQFVLEYVGEHVSQPEAARRADGSCILPLPRRGHAPSTAGIDALHARNAAGFVNFACAPNMAARGVLSEHWDAALPHVAFFATRDIAAGEELTTADVSSQDSSATRRRRGGSASADAPTAEGGSELRGPALCHKGAGKTCVLRAQHGTARRANASQ